MMCRCYDSLRHLYSFPNKRSTQVEINIKTLTDDILLAYYPHPQQQAMA